jgi:cystathionine gamma-synthase
VTASGLAAITLVLHFIEPGGLLVAPHDMYGGTFRLIKALGDRGAFRWRLVNQTDPRAFQAALDERPSMILIETPSNPLLRFTDVAAACAAGRRGGALVVVDNTFLSPALQRPIELGADLVVHSTTKYLNGHSDVVGGAVVAADPAMLEKLTWWANALGLTGSPFDSYLALRGLRTLHARMRVHEENARRVATFLTGQRAVSRVYYPGLESHPGHATALRQQSGFGGMVSFDLAGGRRAVEAFLSESSHFTLAESLGGVESLVAHPATMTHAAMDGATRLAAGIGEGLLRLSVGIEDPDDLIEDLAAAMNRAEKISS